MMKKFITTISMCFLSFSAASSNLVIKAAEVTFLKDYSTVNFVSGDENQDILYEISPATELVYFSNNAYMLNNESNEYLLEFDYDYPQTDNIASKTVIYNEEVGILPNPVRNGYIFLGWYDVVTKEEIKSDFVFNYTDSIQLKAKWEIIEQNDIDNIIFISISCLIGTVIIIFVYYFSFRKKKDTSSIKHQ